MSARRRIFRIQDKDGRGPYKPGTSALWVDECGPPPPPTWMEEFGDLRHKFAPDECLGCGCVNLEQLFRWFTPRELERLYGLGYRLVTMWADRIIAESTNQVVFARKRPLAEGATILANPSKRKTHHEGGLDVNL